MTPNTLAQALVELAHGKSDAELDTLTEHTVTLLERHGKRHMLPDVVASIEKFAAKRDRHAKPVVTVETTDDATRHADAIREALNSIGAGTEYAIQEDNTLVGGFAVEHEAQRIDATYKRNLLRLYSSLVEA